MRRSLNHLVVAVAALAGTLICSHVDHAQPAAHAQVAGGAGMTFSRVSDGATVAWCARSSDGTKEFWAYIDGDFEFAGSSHTASNPWNLRGVYDSNLPTGGFEAFRTEVLSRAAAEDETIIFHNMTVAESITVN